MLGSEPAARNASRGAKPSRPFGANVDSSRKPGIARRVKAPRVEQPCKHRRVTGSLGPSFGAARVNATSCEHVVSPRVQGRSRSRPIITVLRHLRCCAPTRGVFTREAIGQERCRAAPRPGIELHPSTRPPPSRVSRPTSDDTPLQTDAVCLTTADQLQGRGRPALGGPPPIPRPCQLHPHVRQRPSAPYDYNRVPQPS